MTPDHDQIFSEATDYTAHTLANTWLEYARYTGNRLSSPSGARFQVQPSGTSSFPVHWSLHAQTAEMEKAGLDSSNLSPFYLNQTLTLPRYLMS